MLKRLPLENVDARDFSDIVLHDEHRDTGEFGQQFFLTLAHVRWNCFRLDGFASLINFDVALSC